MSDSVYLGRAMTDFDESDSPEGYSKVVIILGEDENGEQVYVEAGDDTARTMEITNPYGTQAMATDILRRLQSVTYKPFNATGAILDPSAEIGDGITASGVYSMLASQSFNFDSLSASDVSAPADEELDHEYPYEDGQFREMERKLAKTRASLIVGIDHVTAQVTDLEGNVQTLVKVDEDGFLVENGSGERTLINGGTIKADTLFVDAANITGALTFQQLDSSTQNTINTASSNASTALSTANSASSAASTASMWALEADRQITAWKYTGTTYIDGTQLMTGTVTASVLQGGEVNLLDQNMAVAGSITIENASTAGHAIDLTSGGALHLIASDGSVSIEAPRDIFLTAGNAIKADNVLYPNSPSVYSLGVSWSKWTDVYADNAVIQTSDLNVKRSVVYDLTEYDKLFDKISPMSFIFKDGHRRHLGIGAQDFEKVIEECGFTTNDVAAFIKSYDEETKEYNYAIRYGEFIPLLIDQVQRLKSRVAELEASQ